MALPYVFLYFSIIPFRSTDNETIASYLITFRSRSTLNLWVSHNYVKLLAPFDPTNSGRDNACDRHGALFWCLWLWFVFQTPSILTYAASVRNGGYYANGSRFTLTLPLGIGFSPMSRSRCLRRTMISGCPKLQGIPNSGLSGQRIDVNTNEQGIYYSFCSIQRSKRIMSISMPDSNGAIGRRRTFSWSTRITIYRKNFFSEEPCARGEVYLLVDDIIKDWWGRWQRVGSLQYSNSAFNIQN